MTYKELKKIVKKYNYDCYCKNEENTTTIDISPEWPFADDPGIKIVLGKNTAITILRPENIPSDILEAAIAYSNDPEEEDYRLVLKGDIKSFRRKYEILKVLPDPIKRDRLQHALEERKTIIVDGSTDDGKALITRLKDYNVSFIDVKDVFYYG